MIQAYQEELISLDELRERMPELRARETSLRSQLDALAAQLVDREVYLKLAEHLEGFLARLRDSAATATTSERQRVLRLLVSSGALRRGRRRPSCHRPASAARALAAGDRGGRRERASAGASV
jgi:DNA repair exonuclease SbcCD ATPase subunit